MTVAGADWAGRRLGDRATGRLGDRAARRLGDGATGRWAIGRVSAWAMGRMRLVAARARVVKSPKQPDDPAPGVRSRRMYPALLKFGKAPLHVARAHPDRVGDGRVAREAMVLEPRPLTDQGDDHQLGRGGEVGVRDDLVNPRVGPTSRLLSSAASCVPAEPGDRVPFVADVMAGPLPLVSGVGPWPECWCREAAAGSSEHELLGRASEPSGMVWIVSGAVLHRLAPVRLS